MVNPFTWLYNKRKQRKEEKRIEREGKEEKLRQADQVVQTLKSVPLLSSLSDEQLRKLSHSFGIVEFAKGEDVCKIGDIGDEFYLIHVGTADVLGCKDGEEFIISGLRALDYFGEQALITDKPRNATIRATSETLELLVLTRGDFQSLNKSGEILFAQRQAVMAEDAIDLSHEPKWCEHGDLEAAFIKASIEQNLLFSSFSAHSDNVLDAVLKHFFPVKVPKGEAIITEGEMHGTKFYVIAEGSCEVSTKEKGHLCELGKGQCFGELALMYNAPRNATVKAATDCQLFVMERQAFRYQVVNIHKNEDDANFGFLRQVKLFQSLLNEEVTLIGMALTERECEANELIFSQGDAGDKFYLVKEGQCEGTKLSDADHKKEQFVIARGGFFGECALLHDESRTATIHAGEHGCTVLQLSREDFKLLLGPLKSILQRNAEEYNKSPAERHLFFEDQKNICELEELQTIGLLGRGAFGKVTLVVDPHTKKSYALKAIKKTQIEEIGQSSHIVNEKRVMMMMENRFLVNLRRTYKDEWRVYFLVDVCLGGELFSILRKHRSFNDEQTRFYIGCVVEAFSYMHGMHIIYRDLKPENLVMDETGYIKVTDFGFAKVCPKKTYTLCGTPDYLAPEIVTGQGHGKAVDWWCCGVLIYELLSSFPPFFDDEPMGTYRKIIQGKFKFPKYFTADARDLIARLLRTRPTKRLAMMKGGADNIRNHVWYNGFDWDALRSGEMEAPWKPAVKSHDDISNFDQRDKRASAADMGKPPKTPWDSEF